MSGILCRSVERPWHKTIVASAVALEKAVTVEVAAAVRVTVAATLVVVCFVTVRVAVLPMLQVRAEAGLASVAKAM